MALLAVHVAFLSFLGHLENELRFEDTKKTKFDFGTLNNFVKITGVLENVLLLLQIPRVATDKRSCVCCRGIFQPGV